jgi:uncharacterized protein
MQIAVPSLRRGRHTFTTADDARSYGKAAAECGLDFFGPIRVAARVDKIQTHVLVRGTAETTVRFECARCLEPFDLAVTGTFDALFLPMRREELADSLAHRFEAESQQVHYYESGVIDLGEHIIEAVVLAAPRKPLCGAECRGLCPTCGKNLNEGACGCKRGTLSYQPFKGLFGGDR